MTFLDKFSFKLKTVRFYIIMTQLFLCHTNIDNNCTLTARSLLIIYGTYEPLRNVVNPRKSSCFVGIFC